MQSVSKFEIMFDVQGSFHKTAKEEEKIFCKFIQRKRKWILNLFCFLGPK